ncbi:MAG: DMT family transporter [Ignavibacteria bacterium]|nr:DMT family transporter [Ignavibacteria bacterium]
MNTRKKAELILFATSFIWGGTFVVVKLGLNAVSPVFYTAVRFLIAFTIFLPLFYSRTFPLSKTVIRKGLILGGFLLVGFITQVIGLNITTASKSGFFTGMLVVFTPLLQIIIERKFPKIGNIVGVVFVALGLFFLTSPEGSEFNVGDFLTIVCAVVYAFYIIYLDVYSDEDVFQLTFMQFAVVGFGALFYSFLFEEISFQFNSITITSLAYTSLLATLLSTYTQTKYQKDTTPTRAAVIFSIEPVLSAILAFFILNEYIGIIGAFGGALIVTGILISETSDSWKIFQKKAVE